jgi:hypothetical protein
MVHRNTSQPGWPTTKRRPLPECDGSTLMKTTPLAQLSLVSHRKACPHDTETSQTGTSKERQSEKLGIDRTGCQAEECNYRSAAQWHTRPACRSNTGSRCQDRGATRLALAGIHTRGSRRMSCMSGSQRRSQAGWLESMRALTIV